MNPVKESAVWRDAGFQLHGDQVPFFRKDGQNKRNELISTVRKKSQPGGNLDRGMNFAFL